MVTVTDQPGAPTTVGPTSSPERVAALDAVRGFALLGILVVNIPAASHAVQVLALQPPQYDSALDRIVAWLVRFFFEGKFFPLFSLLFGIGFALQMQRVEARGSAFGWLYARRLFVLLAIGLIHAYFLWSGDILVPYAVLGFVMLLFFRRAKARTLLIWAGIALVIPVLVNAALLGLLTLGRTQPEVAADIDATFAQQTAFMRAAGEAATRIYQHGSLAEIHAQRVQDTLFLQSAMILFIAPTVLAMFLLGAWTVRTGIVSDLAGHREFLRRVLRWGLLVGLPGAAVFAWGMEVSQRSVPTTIGVLAQAAGTLTGPALAAAYASGLVLLILSSERWRDRLAPVGAAGRMALTNYLLQSLVFTTVLYSFGLARFGRMGATEALALAIAIYVAELWLSTWWLSRFRYGPMEWVWRSLSYLRRQPMQG